MHKFDEALDRVLARHDELAHLLAQAGGLEGERFVKASKEFAEVAPVAEAIRALRRAEAELKDAAEIADDPVSDAEMRTLAGTERRRLSDVVEELGRRVRVLLL